MLSNKIIIVDSVDDLNNSSSNSFLKTLEEPNYNTFIFSISHQLSSLLPTIRSRCLKIKFNKHNFESFNKIINENIKKIDIEEINLLYELTLGSPGNAIKLHNDNILETFDLTVNGLIAKDINSDIINLSNILSSYDIEKFQNYLSIVKSILIILNKIKIKNLNVNNYNSIKFEQLNNIASLISIENILNKLEFLSKNENELFSLNLDKRLFILNFLMQ